MLYLKALHLIFVVTWFAGLFYMPRLFIYNTEAEKKPADAKKILHEQFSIMMKRLWFGITIPSALLTLVLGLVLMFQEGWNKLLFDQPGRWLLIKLIFVVLLYLYFFSLHKILLQQLNGIFRYSSQQLRIWNEMATIFLVAIVMLAVVREGIGLIWGMAGLILFIVLLMSAIRIYKILRSKQP
jgi:putative membrane protein